jgi:hypothetical protein
MSLTTLSILFLTSSLDDRSVAVAALAGNESRELNPSFVQALNKTMLKASKHVGIINFFIVIILKGQGKRELSALLAPLFHCLTASSRSKI